MTLWGKLFTHKQDKAGVGEPTKPKRRNEQSVIQLAEASVYFEAFIPRFIDHPTRNLWHADLVQLFMLAATKLMPQNEALSIFNITASRLISSSRGNSLDKEAREKMLSAIEITFALVKDRQAIALLEMLKQAIHEKLPAPVDVPNATFIGFEEPDSPRASGVVADVVGSKTNRPSAKEKDVEALCSAACYAIGFIKRHNLNGGMLYADLGGTDVYCQRVGRAFRDAAEKILASEAVTAILKSTVDKNEPDLSDREMCTSFVLLLDKAMLLIGKNSEVMPLALLKADLKGLSRRLKITLG